MKDSVFKMICLPFIFFAPDALSSPLSWLYLEGIYTAPCPRTPSLASSLTPSSLMGTNRRRPLDSCTYAQSLRTPQLSPTLRVLRTVSPLKYRHQDSTSSTSRAGDQQGGCGVRNINASREVASLTSEYEQAQWSN